MDWWRWVTVSDDGVRERKNRKDEREMRMRKKKRKEWSSGLTDMTRLIVLSFNIHWWRWKSSCSVESNTASIVVHPRVTIVSMASTPFRIVGVGSCTSLIWIKSNHLSQIKSFESNHFIVREFSLPESQVWITIDFVNKFYNFCSTPITYGLHKIHASNGLCNVISQLDMNKIQRIEDHSIIKFDIDKVFSLVFLCHGIVWNVYCSGHCRYAILGLH